MANVKNGLTRYKLPIMIEPQKGGGYTASSPVWADCYAQGDTVDEAILEVTAVAQSLIELYKEEGLKIPLKKIQQEPLKSPLNVPVIVSS